MSYLWLTIKLLIATMCSMYIQEAIVCVCMHVCVYVCMCVHICMCLVCVRLSLAHKPHLEVIEVSQGCFHAQYAHNPCTIIGNLNCL